MYKSFGWVNAATIVPHFSIDVPSSHISFGLKSSAGEYHVSFENTNEWDCFRYIYLLSLFTNDETNRISFLVELSVSRVTTILPIFVLDSVVKAKRSGRISPCKALICILFKLGYGVLDKDRICRLQLETNDRSAKFRRVSVQLIYILTWYAIQRCKYIAHILSFDITRHWKTG